MVKKPAKPNMEELRKKVRAMSDVELRALSDLLKRRRADYIDEIRVIDDQLLENQFKRAMNVHRRKSS